MFYLLFSFFIKANMKYWEYIIPVIMILIAPSF